MQETISLSSKIRINEDVVSRNLQGQIVLLNLKTNLYCGLDNVGAKIWRLLNEQANKHKLLKDVLSELVKEFDVSEAKCTEDLLNFVRMLKEKDLIEI